MKSMWNLVLVAAVVGSSAFASGWRCTGEEGYRVKLNNHTDATRTPAVLVVSQAEGGTLITAKDEEIGKKLVSNGTRYTATAGSHDALDGDVVFYVNYREGKDAALKNGATRYGKLIVNYHGGGKDTVDLNCTRYLKN